VSNPEKGYRIGEVPMVVISFRQEPTEDQKGAMANEGFQPIGDEKHWAAPADERTRNAAMKLDNEFSGRHLPYWQVASGQGRG
jgi:hypothetical protein